jgi:hypothetical protein
MRMISVVCGVVMMAAAGSGCLRKEVGQTIYLGPSGAVWTVIERDVRSDEKDPAARIGEEQDYVLAARAGQHGVARAFRSLGAGSVTTTWLRRERPYSVMTEARFADVRQLALAILREAKAQGDVTLTRDGCRTKFGMRVNLEAGTESEDGSPLDALLSDLETYRIVLTEGRFISADGFEILDEGSIAVPDTKTAPVPSSLGEGGTGGILTLALAWAGEGC